ncbi:hypothetical protein OKA05_19355 [Luteolibacter arcticus]|uniref:SLH domain-containing protein n=1 Tax=Luteolibacter arcticus TaxID=1581411 RepID=A0ABT3GMN5_9BACT|nr:hypothetical protein [Luteolibacter arcticus]
MEGLVAGRVDADGFEAGRVEADGFEDGRDAPWTFDPVAGLRRAELLLVLRDGLREAPPPPPPPPRDMLRPPPPPPPPPPREPPPRASASSVMKDMPMTATTIQLKNEAFMVRGG